MVLQAGNFKQQPDIDEPTYIWRETFEKYWETEAQMTVENEKLFS